MYLMCRRLDHLMSTTQNIVRYILLSQENDEVISQTVVNYFLSIFSF